MSVQPAPATLKQIADAAVRDIARKIARVELNECSPDSFEIRDTRSLVTVTQGDYELIFVLSTALQTLAALVQNMRHGKIPDLSDTENYSCEFLNILCGQVVSRLNRTLHVSARFSVPQIVDGLFEYKSGREMSACYEFGYSCCYGPILVRTLFRWNTRNEAVSEATGIAF